MAKEIERKWLLSNFPEGKEPSNEYMIYQSYLVASDEIEIRIRLASPTEKTTSIISSHKLTIKSNGDLVREENEIELSPANYAAIAQLINKPAIKKLYRTYILDNGIKLEVSQVDEKWFYAEVEFNSETEAESFVFPWQDLVKKEVTYDEHFKMKNYWKTTRR